METNSIADIQPATNVSIISFETLFNSTESDFAEWEFYDNSTYDSALALFPNVQPY
ncbi:MAG: hypothetical protein JWP81_1703 [Ferruginibacter sp.]|nr:hypothetical protein [Ferruginibacter sp.]